MDGLDWFEITFYRANEARKKRRRKCAVAMR
jgi:hypothetical protein